MIKEDDENEDELLVNACLMVEEETNDLSENNTSNNLLKCELCHQFMQSLELRSLHYVLNHGCSICSVCSQVFMTLNSFKIHVRSNHSQFLCDLCEIVFLTHGELLKHRNNFHELFKCPLCIFEFFSESHVDSHLLKYHRISVTNFLLVNNYVAEWTELNQTYHCNMCGDKKYKVDVFSHFLLHHQISLLPLAQKFMSQNLNIRVIGIDSEIDCQSIQNVSFCKGCSGKVSEEVPLSAHKFICLGDIMCKLCLQSQGNQLTRDVHITEEHKNYPCALGCSNRTVFDTEEKLHEHCLTVHDVKPCFLCGSYVRCAEGLMKQHLQMDHSYYRSDEILSSDSLFNVHCGNLTIGLICSLCDFDALIQISSIDDLFKHLNYHSISLRAAFHFLEKDNLHQSLCMKLNQIRFTQKASIQTKGSEQNVDEFYQLPYSDIEYSSTINTHNSQQNYCQFDQPMKTFLGEESISMLETNGKIEPYSVQESNGFDINNIEDTVNGTENNCILHKDNLIMENIFPGPSSSEEKENFVELIEDSGTPRAEYVPKYTVANVTRDMKDEFNPPECEQEETTDELESRTGDIDDHIRTEGANEDVIGDHGSRWNNEEDVDCDGNENSQSASNSNKIVNNSSVLDEGIVGEYSGNPQNNIKEEDKDCPNRGIKNKNKLKKLRLDVLNTKSIVHPGGVECVVTDISDIEDSDCEMEVDCSNSNMQSAGSSSSAGMKSRKRKESRDPKSLPGLNRIDVGPNGFTCGVCCGKFKRHEGMRELLKHMRRLHGFSCNFNGAKQAEAFKYKRGKAGSSMSMQPGLVCPECSTGWKSKRLLRKHFTTKHGIDSLDKSKSDPLSYKCRYCEQSFWKANECFTHETDNHSDQRAYQCHLCDYSHFRKVILNRHLKLAHPTEKLHSHISFKCKQCWKLYPTFQQLERHVRTSHPLSMVFRCLHCQRVLKSKRFLAKHVEKQHINAPHLCKQCGRRLGSKRALSTHMRMKHNPKTKCRYKCRLCEKTFDSKELRSSHYAADHPGEKKFKCNECGKGFNSKSGVYTHKQTHLMSFDAFKCKHCEKSFSRRDSFNEHQQIHGSHRHKCSHCAKTFVQRSNMVRHIRIHTGEKPYKCSFCDKKFSDKGACNSHMSVHNREEQQSACPYCDRKFLRKQKLKYHIKKHTGEGLIPCQLCGKSFTHNYQLKSHMSFHKRQVTCKECGRFFINTNFLQRHTEAFHPTHVFSCQLCPKTYCKEAEARKHLISHASYKTLQCPLCEKSYTTMNTLKKHLTAIHKLMKDHPDFKSTVDNLSAEYEKLISDQKEKDFNSFMVIVPISQSKNIDKSKKKKDSNSRKVNKTVEKKRNSLTNSHKKDAKDEGVSNIGDRVLRYERKSRPKNLSEIDDEDDTSGDIQQDLAASSSDKQQTIVQTKNISDKITKPKAKKPKRRNISKNNKSNIKLTDHSTTNRK